MRQIQFTHLPYTARDQLIIMEEDMFPFVNYNKWWNVLQREGFKQIWRVHDTYDSRPNGKYASWSTKMFHSVWHRVGVVPAIRQGLVGLAKRGCAQGHSRNQAASLEGKRAGLDEREAQSGVQK